MQKMFVKHQVEIKAPSTTMTRKLKLKKQGF